MAVVVTVQYGLEDDSLPPRAAFDEWVASALEGRREQAEVVIRVVGAAEAARLNQVYRHRAGPTNVLSFPADLPAEVDHPLLGDIVICAPVVVREAREQGKEQLHHWAHMAVHGTLHLLGYDHREAAEAASMEAEEHRILSRLGIPDPYREESYGR